MRARVHGTATPTPPHPTPTPRPRPETRLQMQCYARVSRPTFGGTSGQIRREKKKVALVGAADVCENPQRVSGEQRKGNSSL